MITHIRVPIIRLALLFSVALHANSFANPAVITRTSIGGVGHITLSSGQNGINAQIGAWGTPYPYGRNGPLSGVEPSGASILTVDIDVQEGGFVQFRYALNTYDVDSNDWLDITLITPTGPVSIVSRLGNSGGNRGRLFRSPRVAISHDLLQWANQHVQLVFSVSQDGFGDQTMAEILGLTISDCAIPALTPLTDTQSLSFEAGNTIDTGHLTPAMRTALTSFEKEVKNVHGNFKLTSAYRPPNYQAHLREVWELWNPPVYMKNNTDPRCQGLKAKVQAEFKRHGLGVSSQRPAGANGSHTQGLAIDVRTDVLDIDSTAISCQLHRPFPIKDPVHFEHKNKK
jgi:hypothetical protein